MITNKTYILILIYSSITLLLVALLNIYISQSNVYQSKMQRIDGNYEVLRRATKNNSSDNLLLVIGNSYVNASFNSSVKDENILRFTVFGMTLIEIVNIIENLPEKTPIDKVLIGLGYNYAIPVNADSSSYDKHFSSNPLNVFWSSLPMVRGRSLTSTIIKEDILCLSSSIVRTRCKKNSTEQIEESISQISPEKHQSNMIVSTKERFNEYIPFTSSIGSNFHSYLKRLKIACDIRGITLHTYTAPIYKELRNRLNPKTIEEFRHTINITGINYVDMNLIFPDWEADMFSDATHVSTTSGANDTITLFLKKNLLEFDLQ